MKAVDQIRRQTAQKRGGTGLCGKSVFAETRASHVGGLSQMLHDEPTPEIIASMDEPMSEMFRMVPDDSLRLVAQMRFEGYTNDDIAVMLDVSVRSVERKLKVIREIWIVTADLPLEGSE